jgi:hypothetical protein
MYVEEKFPLLLKTCAVACRLIVDVRLRFLNVFVRIQLTVSIDLVM